MGSYAAPPYLRDNVSTVFVIGNCGIDISFLHQFPYLACGTICDHVVNLHHLSNVNLSEDRPAAIADADFVGLVSLRSLSMNHCSLTTLDTLKGN